MCRNVQNVLAHVKQKKLVAIPSEGGKGIAGSPDQGVADAPDASDIRFEGDYRSSDSPDGAKDSGGSLDDGGAHKGDDGVMWGGALHDGGVTHSAVGGAQDDIYKYKGEDGGSGGNALGAAVLPEHSSDRAADGGATFDAHGSSEFTESAAPHSAVADSQENVVSDPDGWSSSPSSTSDGSGSWGNPDGRLFDKDASGDAAKLAATAGAASTLDSQEPDIEEDMRQHEDKEATSLTEDEEEAESDIEKENAEIEREVEKKMKALDALNEQISDPGFMNKDSAEQEVQRLQDEIARLNNMLHKK